LEDPVDYGDDDVDAPVVAAAAPTEVVVAALPPPPPSSPSSSSSSSSGGDNDNTGSNVIANSTVVNSTAAAGGDKETAAAKQTTPAPAASGGGEVGEPADEDGDGLTPAQLPTYEELEEEAMEDEGIYENIEEVQGGISALEADRANATDPIAAAGIETEIEDLEAVEEELLEEALEGGMDEAFGFDDDAAVFIGNNNGTSGVGGGGGGDGDDEIAWEGGDDYSPPNAEILEEEIEEIEEEIKGRCCSFCCCFCCVLRGWDGIALR
jgi:hypothetical protein